MNKLACLVCCVIGASGGSAFAQSPLVVDLTWGLSPTSPSGLPTYQNPDVPDHMWWVTNSDPNVVARSYGLTNFLDKYPTAALSNQFKPFPPTSTIYPMAIGDRLGYDVCAVFDVNGDGYNDWCETWYHAEPRSALDSEKRVPEDAIILPGVPTMSSTPTRDDLCGAPFERVGFCRIISGLQDPKSGEQSRIGSDIWGNADNSRLAHEIAAMRDIDGDGRGEVLLASNTTDGGRGSINVFAFTSRYNTDTGDSQERWVCIMRIVGATVTSELAYELEDNLADFNNDGQVDILAASVWWRTAGHRDSVTGGHRQRGAGWIFLTPPTSLFEAIQTSTTWPALPGNSLVKSPLVLTEADASLTVSNPPCVVDGAVPSCSYSLPVADLASAGDLDGDDRVDFVVNAGTTGSGRGMYFFLSTDGYSDETGKTLEKAPAKYESLNANGSAPLPHPAFEYYALELVPAQADFVIKDGPFDGENYTFHDYTTSIFGMDFTNGSESQPGATDLPLLLFKNSATADIFFVKDFALRCQSSGDLRHTVEGPVHSNTNFTPFQYPFHCKPIHSTPDYGDFVITSLSIGEGGGDNPSITGIQISGNTDGLGKFDCEMSVSLARGIFNTYRPDPGDGAPNRFAELFNRGYNVVLDFPPDNPQNPVKLIKVSGEMERFDSRHRVPGDPSPIWRVYDQQFGWENQFPSNLQTQDIRVGYQACGGLPGWDQDRDGRDDLLITCPTFPRAVRTLPGGATIPVGPTNAFQPYAVDGGANYLILSPARAPSGATITRSFDVNTGRTIFVITAKSLVPKNASLQPFNAFANHSDVKFVFSGNPDVGADDTELSFDPLNGGMHTLTVSFNGLLPDGGTIRIPTRGNPAFDVPAP